MTQNELEKQMACMDYVVNNLTERVVLEGLAEECAELQQAALKLIRALTHENPTPVTADEARANLAEEAADVMAYLYLMDVIPEEYVASNPKWLRWAQRIREARDGF